MRSTYRTLVAFVMPLLCLALLVTTHAAPRESLRIAFIAYENPNRLSDDVQPVVEYLEQRLGRKVEHFAATDYAGVVEALRNGTADVGFMGPLQYIIAHHHAGAYPILGEIYGDSPTYRARIFVRKDSGIRSIKELRGKTIAFVDPISSSGYMYPLEVFTNAKLIADRAGADTFFKRIYFAGGDEQAIRAVHNRFVDSAGIGEYAYSLLKPSERDELIHIADSRPLPSHCVVVRKGLERDRAEQLREALLALNDGPNSGLLKNLYNVDGYVTVDHSTYAEVEQIARRHGFIGD